MADVTVKKLSDLDSYQGQFLFAGKGLGVSSFGMNVLQLPPSWEGYPEHDHADDGQEEVYVVLEGDATLIADGERFLLKPWTLARVGPDQKRKIVPGSDGATILALGGIPGKAFAPR